MSLKITARKALRTFFPLICKFTYFISKETGAWTLARELEGSSCQYRQFP